MRVYELETPALIVDLDVLERNSRVMMEAIVKSKANLRPHFKSHKCTEIAKFQLKNGAIGLTCAKLSEAEAIVRSGISCDLLIANQIVEKSKLDRLAALCKNNTLTVCVDCVQNVYDLQAALEKQDSDIGILIEYEIGMERCGVRTAEEFYEVYQAVKQCSRLRFRGIQAYAGHISHEVDCEKRLQTIKENNKNLCALIEFLTEKGVEVEVVSGASTGTAFEKMNEGIYNEIQAGSYLFLDDCYNKMGLKFENSLFVLTTVVSKKENLLVVDAGVKTVGVDQGLPSIKGETCGRVVASEEHFQFHNPSKQHEIGEKILLIPAHCCSTNNLHEFLYFVKDGVVVKAAKIDGRGFGK